MPPPAGGGALPVVSKLRSPEPAPGSGDATPPGAAGSIGTPVIVGRVVEVGLVVAAATAVAAGAGPPVVGVVGTVVGVVGVHGSYPFPLPGPPRGLSQAGGIPPGGSARAATGTTASTAAINSTTPAPRRFPMAPYRHLRTIISSADREDPKKLARCRET